MKLLIIDNAEQLPLYLAGLDIEPMIVFDEVQALHAAERQQPEIILLDYALLGEETPEYIGLLLEASRLSKVLVIGENVGEDDILHCLLMGANGYQDKQRLSVYIDKLIRALAQGEAWISRKMVARVLDTIRQLNNQALAV